MKQIKELPVLLDEAQVRRLLGKIPRDLENMVMHDPKARKLYRRAEVMQRLNWREPQ